MRKLPQPTVRRDYRLKLIEATTGNQSMLGCIVLVAIGKEPENPPYFRGKAIITNRGDVLCDFVERDGSYRTKARISDDEDLVRNLINLTVHCDLNEQERVEFLARVNEWIAIDERETSRIKRVMLS